MDGTEHDIGVTFSPLSFLQVYSSIYFCGHLFFFTAFMVLPYLRKALVPKREKKQD